MGEGFAGDNGEWSITLSEGLSDGPHTLRAAIHNQDSGLDELLIGPEVTITIDATAPDAPVELALSASSDSGVRGDGLTSVATPTVAGIAEAHATVLLFDGERLLGTAKANGDGAWSITSTELNVGAHELYAVQADVAGNYSIGATLSVISEKPATVIDGVTVITTPVTLPGGNAGTSIIVPVVTPDRVEGNGNFETADIPLSTDGGMTMMLARVHTGSGLSATGGMGQRADDGLAQLIATINATSTETGSIDIGGMTGAGHNFLSLLPTDVPLMVQGVTLTGDGVVDFTGHVGSERQVALVLDSTQVAGGGTITLQDIPFAAVFGKATVLGDTQGQILTGDGASQTFMVTQAAGSTVLAGGGNDVLEFGLAAGSAGASQGLAVTPATTLLHGGTSHDTVVLQGAMADYPIVYNDGYLLVSSIAAPDQVAKLVNVEAIQCADKVGTLQHRAELTTLAGRYDNVLGRQADADGFAYWGKVQEQGASLGEIAVSMISSGESVVRAGPFTGDVTNDLDILYAGIFNRAADQGGREFWAEQMAQGVSLEQVADAMAHSAEIVGHQVVATDWNFTV